jgi:rare lipoprotein A
MKLAIVLLGVLLLATGCSHRPQVARVPETPLPPAAPEGTPPGEVADKTQAASRELDVPADTKPILTETGIASWYGAPYHNRRASNGEVYDMHAMTAAHRTFPLGSVARVTNQQTHASAVVRITDRGPFVDGRIIDLSQAAAQKIGMIQKGTTKVTVELLQIPAAKSEQGRWAVQIGAFDREQAARQLAAHLTRRYHSARVLTFNSPIGDWWVRVRVKDDLRARAEEVLRDTKTPEGSLFLVRLD